MTRLRKAAESYLDLRRRLGFDLRSPAGLLRRFVSFMEEHKAQWITTELALRWAKVPADAEPATWARRLSIVRRFARHWSATDPRTEIPPLGLLPYRYRRRPPYVYTNAEILRLIRAAEQLPPIPGLRRWTYRTLLGLLAVSGLRLSEALALDQDAVDVSERMLTIRRAKFGKSRYVPLHPSAIRALHRYARRRDRFFPIAQSPAFFVSDRGRRLTQSTIRWTFNKLSRQVGLRGLTDRSGPRLHDFRHRFAISTLLGWYRAGRNAERLMPLLSTYLGHTHVADTYWYISAVPELLRLAAARLERTLGVLP